MAYPPSRSPQITHKHYPIGVICALATEKAAFEAMLDQVHAPLPNLDGDDNSYTFGQIGVHNIVVACLPAGMTGNNSAATVAKDMLRSFPIKIGLMVGIGGGVWSQKVDVRLGDVIVSQPDGMSGGVVQWDFGKMEKGSVFRRTGMLNKPPRVLLNALQDLKIKHMMEGDGLNRHLSEMAQNKPRMAQTFGYPGDEHDQLFDASYDHPSGETCDYCDPGYIVRRLPARASSGPHVHYGNIASGNEVIKDGTTRDQIALKEGVICFEMEAAGLMDSFPCLVIRGICDYADSHKNKKWQPYAAATAAAFAKELLSFVEKQDVDEVGPAKDTPYLVPFSLEGVPRTNKFVNRPADMAEVERTLIPHGHNQRQKVFVLYGLGGIGKTQLAVEFIRRHHLKFSCVFWLDGDSEDSLKQSIAVCGSRIPAGQISDISRGYSRGGDSGVDVVVAEVMGWLARPDNTNWLLVFDNVDREYGSQPRDPLSYDVMKYFSGADHGSILITTRLPRLGQLGNDRRLAKVDTSLARDIFQEWYGGEETSGYDELLELLDGLPLALAQAASFLRMTKTSIASYIMQYKRHWSDLMRSNRHSSLPLVDYQRSIKTTWMMSFEAVKERDKSAANLLLLWGFLNNRDMWHGLLQATRRPSTLQPEWFCELADNENRFLEAIELLFSYSMIEAMDSEQDSYAMHPVVHTWTSHMPLADERKALLRIAVVAVGHAVPIEASKGSHILQRRLLPHAERCFSWVPEIWDAESSLDDSLLQAAYMLGHLYKDQSKLEEAETMYQRALDGFEKAFGPDYIGTLDTVHALGSLYRRQDKLQEAETMYQRALEGTEKTLGPDDLSTLATVHKLGSLYQDQNKLEEAEAMYQRALRGAEKALGPDDISTLITVDKLGRLYFEQGKLQEAEAMYQRVFEGEEKTLGPEHPSTLITVYHLGRLYQKQGRHQEAEAMYQRALEGEIKALGPDHRTTLITVYQLGRFYQKQGRLQEAEAMYQRALEGETKVKGAEHPSTLVTVYNLGSLYQRQGRLQDAEAMYRRALEGENKVHGPDHPSTLLAARALDSLYPLEVRAASAPPDSV